MLQSPAHIPTTAQLKLLESLWIQSCHPDWGLVLMEIAGSNIARIAISLINQKPHLVTILCGSGNNGGDGLVVARYLYLSNIPVAVYRLASSANSETKPLTKEQTANARILAHLGIPINDIQGDNLESLQTNLANSHLIVDALLGTGLDRPLKGHYAQVIDAINASNKPVLAVDIPSGIHADTGQIMGTAVAAYMTVTLGCLKAGLLCYPGADLAGRIALIDIGLPDVSKIKGIDSSSLANLSNPKWQLATATDIASHLPSRPVNSHKGDFGTLLSIAGSMGMMGAAYLTAYAALRSGVGLSTLATPRSSIAQLPASEIIYQGLDETASGTISLSALKSLEDKLDKASACALGPGLSLNVETSKFVIEFLSLLEKPCVIDADGLNAIAQVPGKSWANRNNKLILTPHPKELSRLIAEPVAYVQANRIAAAQRAALQFGCVVILKGAHSVVATCNQEVFIIPTGNAGMATGGAGDVLTGIIGGLLAQGIEAMWAAVAGTYIHGAAGDLAAEEAGKDGLTASDIISHVPNVLLALRSGKTAFTNLEMQLFQRSQNLTFSARH